MAFDTALKALSMTPQRGLFISLSLSLRNQKIENRLCTRLNFSSLLTAQVCELRYFILSVSRVVSPDGVPSVLRSIDQFS